MLDQMSEQQPHDANIQFENFLTNQLIYLTKHSQSFRIRSESSNKLKLYSSSAKIRTRLFFQETLVSNYEFQNELIIS